VRRPIRNVAALLIGLLPLMAQAASIESLSVSRDSDRYRVTMQARLDVGADRAFAVLTHYEALPDISKAVKLVRLEPDAPVDMQRVFTRMRACFSFFCRTLEQVQDMRSSASPNGGSLSATVLPDKSDLRYGQADWTIDRCATDNQTCLSFVAELEPKFWIPPVIGPWAMERKLRQEAMETTQGIERLAKAAP
jgi:hypothetical protein